MKLIFLVLILLVTYGVVSECVKPEDWDDELDGMWDGCSCDPKPDEWDDELDGVWDGCVDMTASESSVHVCTDGSCLDDIIRGTNVDIQITSAPSSYVQTIKIPSYENELQSIQTTLAKHEKSMYLCHYVAQAMLYGMDDTLKSEMKNLLQNQ